VSKRPWYKLGFTDDDVVGAGQHERLAGECTRAVEAAPRHPHHGVLETSGEGKYLLYWYVSPEMARLLDEHGVGWRHFLLPDGAASPPADAYSPLRKMP
jgi:hypothetical protein